MFEHIYRMHDFTCTQARNASAATKLAASLVPLQLSAQQALGRAVQSQMDAIKAATNSSSITVTQVNV